MVLIERPVIDKAEAMRRYQKFRESLNPKKPRRPLPPPAPATGAAAPPPAERAPAPHLLSQQELADLFGQALANEILEQRPLTYGRKLTHIMTPAVCQWIYNRHMAPDAPTPLKTMAELAYWNEVITISGTAANKYLAPLRNQGVGNEG